MAKNPDQAYIPPPTHETLTGNVVAASQQPTNFTQPVAAYQPPPQYQQPVPYPSQPVQQGNPYAYQPMQQAAYQAAPVGQPAYQQGQHPVHPGQGASYHYDQQRQSSGGLPYNPNAPMPRTSVLSKCPACGYQGYTEVEFDVGSCAVWSACGLFLITGIFCCWIPYVVDTCKDAKHYCRQCHRQIGIAKP